MRIAVYGKLRAGKSAVCQYLKDNLEDVEVLEFSGAVQQVVDVVYPQHKGTKQRNLLIDVGQHFREYDTDIWVNVIKHKIMNSNAKNIVVAGVRQKNEYDMLKKLGFKFISVNSAEDIRIQRCRDAGDNFDLKTLNDETELVLDGFEADYEIINNRGFKELEISIRNILGTIYAREKCSIFRGNLFSFEHGGDKSVGE